MTGSRTAQEEIALKALTLLMKNKASASVPLWKMRLFGNTCRTLLDKTRHQRLLNDAIWAMPVSLQQQDKSSLAAIELLKLHPHLLFAPGYANGPFGTVYGSAYQIFLGTADTSALRMVDEFIIRDNESLQAKAAEQYLKQFPDAANGNLYSERNKQQIEQVRIDLADIVAALNDDPCTNGYATREVTKEAIQRLREHLAPKEGEVMTSGLYSPPEIMRMIYETYDQNFLAWLPSKSSLYSFEVIGFGERVATPVDAQRYKMGLIKSANDNTPIDRTDSYYSFGKVPRGLSSSYFIDASYWGERVFGAGKRGRKANAQLSHQRFGNLCREIKSFLVTLHATRTAAAGPTL